VNFAKVLRRRIREQADGVAVAGDVNAVVASTFDRDSSVTHVSSQTRANRQQDTASHKGGLMADKPTEYRKLTREELDELAGEELPERAAMSLVNANLAIPINAAVAANVLSDNAIAYADASQITPIDQSQ